MKRISEEVRIDQINALPNITFVRWNGEYKGADSKAVVRCAVDGFEWSPSVNHLINSGHGCPQCCGCVRLTQSECEQKVNEIPSISLVRWVNGHRGSKSRAVFRCAIDGHEWATGVGSVINGKSGCPQCGRTSMMEKRRIPAEEREQQIDKLPNISFLRWVDGYKNGCSKAICRCEIDGSEWSASAVQLVNRRTGCPKCALIYSANARRTPEDEIINKINSRPSIKFVRWDGAYIGVESKVVCRCEIDGLEWSSSVMNFIRGRGCPQCAEYGYRPGKPGTLYALRSECGTMVKIGISNNYKQRHRQLARATPFIWSCIELLHSDDGAVIAEMEKELHSWTEQAIFGQSFSGSTEWRKWDDRIPMWIEEYRARA